MEQNYKNHRRYTLVYHIILPLMWLAFLGGTINNARISSKENQYSACLLVLAAMIMGLFYWYMRVFPLKAQDRAIRAEENFRHYILTNKQLDPRLRMSQIVALRFASDEEFPGLAQRAASENIKGEEIKKLIKGWRADNDRV
jgi:hypothetical protein